MTRRFEEIRRERLQRLMDLFEKRKKVSLRALEGWVALQWGIRQETLYKMLEQLIKARMIRINSQVVEWVGAGVQLEISEKAGEEVEKE